MFLMSVSLKLCLSLYIEKAISNAKYYSNFFTESISAFINNSGNLLQDRIPELYSKTLIGVKSVTEKIKKKPTISFQKFLLMSSKTTHIHL